MDVFGAGKGKRIHPPVVGHDDGLMMGIAVVRWTEGSRRGGRRRREEGQEGKGKYSKTGGWAIVRAECVVVP